MFETLREILVDKLKVPAEEVTPESTAADIDLDSLAIVELSMVLSKEFKIDITEDELTKAVTIGDMATMMTARSAN